MENATSLSQCSCPDANYTGNRNEWKFLEKLDIPFYSGDLTCVYFVFLFSKILPFICVLKAASVGQEPIVHPGRPTPSPVIMAITAMIMEWTAQQVLVNQDISAMDRQFLHVRVYSINCYW